MSQLQLFEPELESVINVSKVTQYSPFRYPGGKTWLVPRIRSWLLSLDPKPKLFIEPFAGGAIAGLTVAIEDYADKVVLIELDDQVASVWRTILGRHGGWLANAISSFNLTHDTARAALSEKARSLRAKAFQTILKNRTFHGGILADGSGMIKYGENGRGILSRWYPETIKRRIIRIHGIRKKISFIEGDGLDIIKNYRSREDAVFFVDPPYTAGGKRAGKRLYRYYDLNHEKLFALLRSCKGDCLLTYDDVPEVRALSHEYGFEYRLISMQNTHLRTMQELLIGKNLAWLKKT